MDLTNDERKWLMLKVSETLYATKKKIDALEDMVGAGYASSERLKDVADAKKNREVLVTLFKKISREVPIDGDEEE